MVRRRFRRNRQTLALRGADQLHPGGGRYVLDVKTAAGDATERNVTLYRIGLGRHGNYRQRQPARQLAIADYAAARDKRVVADGHPELRRAGHRLFHHPVVGNVRAVVGEKRRARFGERLQIGDFPAKPALGDAG